MQRYKQWLKKLLKHERPFQKEGVMYGEMKEDVFTYRFLFSAKSFSKINITLSLVHNAFGKV